MVTFRDEAQLRTFLEDLGDYGKYAAALWSAELRTSDQLANAVDDALKPHVAIMHIGDLRVKAKRYQPVSSKVAEVSQPEAVKGKAERKRVRENATGYYPIRDFTTAKEVIAAYWSSK